MGEIHIRVREHGWLPWRTAQTANGMLFTSQFCHPDQTFVWDVLWISSVSVQRQFISASMHRSSIWNSDHCLQKWQRVIWSRLCRCTSTTALWTNDDASWSHSVVHEDLQEVKLTTYDCWSFTVSAPTMWNTLPYQIVLKCSEIHNNGYCKFYSMFSLKMIDITFLII